MADTRTLAWRRAQALRTARRKANLPEKLGHDVPFSRKYMWRRRDKLFLQTREGYTTLHDDWTDAD